MEAVCLRTGRFVVASRDVPKRTGRYWREHVVPAVLARDGGICHLCGGPGADSADHLVPAHLLREDQWYLLSNLAAVHHNAPPRCNRKRGAADIHRTRRRLGAHQPGTTWKW